ncbi:hypothetical protein BH006_25910 [Salmonella enterica]|uniref:Uncharacterized protein n=1 Tax=Salmonella enterica TaxID=28901 RepID=A0A3F3IAA4_SALER|nr:hypothetical protein [Salmonella enterica]EDQ9732028.1 hypothetical protein [Salmonella enterica subsp. enterica]EJT7258817.1 hypothetical protein [Salmonella enterica]OEH96215.1 hypothetical protein BH006_25910 [Salmonella enterica]
MKDGLFKISGEVSAFFSELALTENLMKKVENEGIERGGGINNALFSQADNSDVKGLYWYKLCRLLKVM